MYLKRDTLLLADVFKNLRKMCSKVYHLDPVKFLSAPGLAWQAALKDNNDDDKKAKDTKRCVIKGKLKFQDCKNCLEAAQIQDNIKCLEKVKLM